MAKNNRTSCLIIALLLSGLAPALAQTTTSTQQHMQLQKTIGQAKPEIVPSLIVINARGASLQVVDRKAVAIAGILQFFVSLIPPSWDGASE